MERFQIGWVVCPAKHDDGEPAVAHLVQSWIQICTDIDLGYQHSKKLPPVDTSISLCVIFMEEYRLKEKPGGEDLYLNIMVYWVQEFHIQFWSTDQIQLN